ncbi:MAG: 50S ribosomal protein L37ae [Candidatus Micrarchaeia archaeon]
MISTVRYGKKLRDKYKEIMECTKKRYKCPNCKKEAVKRISTGIWSCKSCKYTFAGGAYTPETEVGRVVNRIVADLSK